MRCKQDRDLSQIKEKLVMLRVQVIEGRKVQAISKRVSERFVPQQPFGYILLFWGLCFSLLNLVVLKQVLK